MTTPEFFHKLEEEERRRESESGAQDNMSAPVEDVEVDAPHEVSVDSADDASSSHSESRPRKSKPAEDLPQEGTVVQHEKKHEHVRPIFVANRVKDLLRIMETPIPPQAPDILWENNLPSINLEYSFDCAGAIMVDETATAFPAAFILAKLLGLYGIKVSSNRVVHASIPTICGENNHIFRTTATGNKTGIQANMEENMYEVVDGQAVYLQFDYDHEPLAAEAAESQLRFVRMPPHSGECPNKCKFSISTPSDGHRAFRVDSILSVLCIMRGFPISSSAEEEMVGRLRQGDHCQALYTDEAIGSRIYCYGSLYSASCGAKGAGKWTPHRFPNTREYTELARFLSSAVVTVLEAASFKAGPNSDTQSQWA